MDIRLDQPLAPQPAPAPIGGAERQIPAGPAKALEPSVGVPAAPRLRFQSIEQIRTGMRDYYHQVRSAQQRHEVLMQGQTAVTRVGQALQAADQLAADANAVPDLDQRVALATEAQRQTQFATTLRQSDSFRRAVALVDGEVAPGRPGADELAQLNTRLASAAQAAGEEAERAESVEESVQPIREGQEARRVLDELVSQLAGQPASAATLQTNVTAPAVGHLLR